MSGAISFFLGLFGLGAAGAVNAGQNISQSKSRQSLTRSIPHKPPIGQTQIFVRCTSGCAKSGRVSLTVIRTVLESGPALILTVWDPTIRLSFGSVII